MSEVVWVTLRYLVERTGRSILMPREKLIIAIISNSKVNMNRSETYRTYRPTQSNSNEWLGLNLGYPRDPKSGLYCNCGLPSYQVFDLRGGIALNKHISATFAVENIFDTRYRAAHSRLDASGRNFLAGLELWF